MLRRRYPFFVCVCLLLLALFHWRLHRHTAADYWQPGGGADVQAQLNWIGNQLRRGAGEMTQVWYPQGYFFTHVLYGYALVTRHC
jgi:hypothetical protein